MSDTPTAVVYNPAAVEAKWQKIWADTQAFQAKDADPRPPYYILETFPYPSGAGLHVGHHEGYIGSDILARYRRATGRNVLYTMGWDAFGLPAEQFALKTGQHPSVTVKSNIERYTRQLRDVGYSYDWSREINTTDPSYYRWTQWIFLKMFEKGLAYVDRRPVWWCPELKTVLANEEIIDGLSERGSHPVERKLLLQWVLRITAYADRLESALPALDWPESTKRMQQAWIGRSQGAEVVFAVENSTDEKLTVYTTRPDTLFGVTFLVIAPEHPLVARITAPEQKTAVESYIKAASSKSELERTELNKDKTGVFTGSYALNPVNGRRVPVWIADYVLSSYGTGAIIAVPAHDERDYAFAQKYHLEVIPVIEGPGLEKLPYTGPGRMVNSDHYTGMPSDEFKKKIVEDLSRLDKARPTVNYKLRDWLFSRQRYWGEPFPILWLSAEDYKKINRATTRLTLPASPVSYTEDGKTFFAVGLPEGSLPLVLPQVASYQPSGDGRSPLANVKEWVNVFVNIETGETSPVAQCDKCVPATRETNTMPQWAGSSWYYLRYVDPRNSQQLVDPAKEKYWGVPDFYINGAEHAVLHLLYARFWHQFLFDIGVVSRPEPFLKVFHQGIVVGEDGQKMSKSLGNVVNADETIKAYGADTLRLYMMFMGPLEDMKPWSSKGIEGVHRFLHRCFRQLVAEDGSLSSKVKDAPEANPETEKLLHATVKKVTGDIENLRFNTAISALMILLNHIQSAETLSLHSARVFVQLLAPLAPHLGEELWQRLGGQGSVGLAPWPGYDDSKLISATAKIIVQINGKLRGELQLPAQADEAMALAAAQADDKVRLHLAGKAIKKAIFVKGRLLNLVVD